jgi:Cwf15/Cwc15 cell cycle control protein
VCGAPCSGSRVARKKKRKAAGLPVEDPPPVVAAIEDEEANKRRKVLHKALEMRMRTRTGIGMGTRMVQRGTPSASRVWLFSIFVYAHVPALLDSEAPQKVGQDAGDQDDEEDETAQLFRELEVTKRERAAETTRVEQAEAERKARVATANSLLILAAALGNPGAFSVKRR